MNYYVTVRVQIPAEDRAEALVMAADLLDDVNELNNADNAYLCYVTEQDGLNVTELVNNVD